MKCLFVCLMLLVLSDTFISAQKETEFFGQLDAELVFLERFTTSMRYNPASAEEKAKLPAPLADGDRAFTGSLYWHPRKEKSVQAVLVEPANAKPFIYADTNLDGKLESGERYYFSPIENNTADSSYDGRLVLKLPLTGTGFKHYPMLVRHFKSDSKPSKGESRFLTQTLGAFARGKADIGGRKTELLYGFDVEAGSVSFTKGQIGIDGNGDGRIDLDFSSSEMAYAEDETVIFRLGDIYVSTRSIDPATGRIVLRSHAPSEYQRIELRIGALVPDFSFTDFDGKERRLSEFRGKYVLLDFWGTWCGPCVAEIPYLKEAYEKYRLRGFEILGMDQDKDMKKVKKFLAEKGVTWPQATTESIKDLIAKRFRIFAYPTTVLLDPQGKIFSLGRKDQPPLRGEKLSETLEKILPAQER